VREMDRDVKWVIVSGKRYELWNAKVVRIVYHEPQGEGDRHYVDITYNSGEKVRMFNIESIGLESEGEK